jgi:hypothetical protein
MPYGRGRMLIEGEEGDPYSPTVIFDGWFYGPHLGSMGKMISYAN